MSGTLYLDYNTKEKKIIMRCGCVYGSGEDAALCAPFLSRKLLSDLSQWIAFLRRVCFECLTAVSTAPTFTHETSVIDAFYYPASQSVQKRAFTVGTHCDPGFLTVDPHLHKCNTHVHC